MKMKIPSTVLYVECVMIVIIVVGILLLSRDRWWRLHLLLLCTSSHSKDSHSHEPIEDRRDDLLRQLHYKSVHPKGSHSRKPIAALLDCNHQQRRHMPTCLSQGQPFSLYHWNASNWPPFAAYAHVHSFHSSQGYWLTLHQRGISRLPNSAAQENVHSS